MSLKPDNFDLKLNEKTHPEQVITYLKKIEFDVPEFEEGNTIIKQIIHDLNLTGNKNLKESVFEFIENKIYQAYLGAGLKPQEAKPLTYIFIMAAKADPRCIIDVQIAKGHLIILDLETRNIATYDFDSFKSLQMLEINCFNDEIYIKDINSFRNLYYLDIAYTIWLSEEECIEWNLILSTEKMHVEMEYELFENLSDDDFKNEPFCKIENLKDNQKFIYFQMKRNHIR